MRRVAGSESGEYPNPRRRTQGENTAQVDLIASRSTALVGHNRTCSRQRICSRNPVWYCPYAFSANDHTPRCPWVLQQRKLKNQVAAFSSKQSSAPRPGARSRVPDSLEEQATRYNTVPIADASDLRPESQTLSVGMGGTAQRALALSQLKRILGSQTFAKSPRLKHLLHYVVLQWSTGNSNKLDGYSLALDIFKRPASFESGLDPIVRVEMGRLRILLAKYYAVEGCYDNLRIDIPKGSYVPTFTERCVGETETGLAQHQDSFGAVIVLPIILQGAFVEEKTTCVAGVYDQIIYLLTKSPGMRVVSRVSAINLSQHLDARLIGGHVGARFIVEGSVLCLGNTCLIAVHLSDATDGYNLWSERYPTHAIKITETTIRVVQDLTAKIQSFQDVPAER